MDFFSSDNRYGILDTRSNIGDAQIRIIVLDDLLKRQSLLD